MVTSGPLNAEQIRKELFELLDFLLSKGCTDIEVTFGIGCVDPDAPYEPVRMSIVEAKEIIAERVNDGTIELGSCDVDLQEVTGMARIELCHHSDIHFEADATDMIDKVKERWMEKGYHVDAPV